jgi:NADH:ubiquinone oxidoreductase subunit 6 (subunit J)
MIFQIVSLIGAVLILYAFAAQQFRRLEAETKTYQMLNLIGGICLATAAVAARQYGFILLEGSWTIVSAWGVWRMVQSGQSASS